ncbi:dephospho-CoA kinase [Flavobacteriaceae bacterium MAR_2010_72]|nr:dephospho-CoA kinase [Flavobacteriaceae bacterium MAR_2010_72]TVZ59436.1 dephospho-CoA kinase [Flavobacteriaceae bacterium MAR_2010_105]
MQMKIVGLTGGIGSGKTTVANMFRELGVPIYIADVEAKNLMHSSKVVKRKLITLFGDKAYINGDLNKPHISSKIFSDQSYLDRMNAIVHPKVAQHFKSWLKKQTTAYIIKEAAIIFEHNMQSQYDYIITVTANHEERIRRILSRDKTTKDKVLTIMKHQWSDEVKIKLSDFVIVNDRLEDTKEQVLKVHNVLLKEVNNSKF